MSIRGGAITIKTVTLEIETSGQGDVHDLTAQVAEVVAGCGAREGVVTVFVSGSTAGVTTIEFENGCVADLDRAFESIAPRAASYRHHLRWGDDNGSSHVRAAMLGPSLSVPFADGDLLIGTWQQIVLVEFDTRPRTRRFVVQVFGG